MIKDIPCVILAGGKSSRMGEDKSLLPFGNFDTLCEYQYNKLSKIFSKVYISSKTDKFNFPCNIIYDNNLEISSPMIALKSILEFLEKDKVFIITVDVPLVNKETIDKLILNSKDYDVTIAQDKDKIHNLCGIFSKQLLNNINISLQNNMHKINYLLKKSNSSYISFSDNEEFLNINRIDEYNRALEIYKKY